MGEVHDLPILKEHNKRLEDGLRQVPINEVLTFEQMSEMAGINVRERRSVIAAARRGLLNHGGKWLANVKGIGYKICAPEYLADEARAYRKRSGRNLKRGNKILKVVDFSSLDDDGRQRTVNELGKMQLCLVAFEASKSDKVNWALPPTQEAVKAFLLEHVKKED